jgi:predicted nucleotidyltransferase
MLEKDKIINVITNVLLENNNIIFAYIFGSFILKDNFKDIDIGIYISDIKKINILNLEFEIEKKLEDLLRQTFDVRAINKAPISFVYNILKNKKIIIDKDSSLRADFENIIYKDYFDLQYLHNEYLLEIRNASI